METLTYTLEPNGLGASQVVEEEVKISPLGLSSLIDLIWFREARQCA